MILVLISPAVSLKGIERVLIVEPSNAAMARERQVCPWVGFRAEVGLNFNPQTLGCRGSWFVKGQGMLYQGN